MRVPARGVEVGERKGRRTLPEVPEPVLHEVGVMARWIAQVEFGVRRQSGVGQVRGTREHGGLELVLHEECLAVQKAVLVAADLDSVSVAGIVRAQPLDQPPRSAVRLAGEARQVPFGGEPGLVHTEGLVELFEAQPGLRRPRRCPVRFRAQQQTDPRRPLQFVEQQRDAGRIDVGRRNGDGLRSAVRPPLAPEQPVDLRRDRFAPFRPVRGEDGREDGAGAARSRRHGASPEPGSPTGNPRRFRQTRAWSITRRQRSE